MRPLRQLRKWRDVAALLWPHARPHKALLLGGAGLSTLVVVFRVAQPWPLKWILDLLTDRPLPPVLGGGGCSTRRSSRSPR